MNATTEDLLRNDFQFNKQTFCEGVSVLKKNITSILFRKPVDSNPLLCCYFEL